TQFRPIMIAACLVHLRQQFLLELFVSQEPAALDGAPIGLGIFLAPALFHALSEPLPARWAILGDPPLAQKPVGAQPTNPLTGCFEVLTITAPGIGLQRLPGLEQVGANRIEMDVIADGFEVAIAAAMHDERLVTAGEEVAKFLVPTIE